MTPYQQFIHMTRYSRWLPEKKRRETWTETVQRYVDFFVEERGNTPEAVNVLKGEIFHAIHNMEVMPSMRALMTAGEALRRENIAGFNCFAGSVPYMTRNGDRTFSETVGTTQEVLAGDGEWRKAEVRSFGTQKVQTVILRPGARSRTSLRINIKVTPDHRWITGRGEVTDLKIGDTIPFNNPVIPEFNAEHFIAGFGFGDGTLDSRGRARIRLCGEKAQYLSLFEQYGNCSLMFPPSYGEDPLVVFHKGHFADWKNLPETVGYWWLRGYIAADGHSNPVQPGLSTQDSEAAQYVVENSAYAGMALTGLNSLTGSTNFGPRSAPLLRLGLREDLDFRVVDIQSAGEEEVFCVTEPVTGQFTLSRGVLTGNCSYLAVNNKRAFSEALYILMCGTGVGFSCERQEINKLPQVPNKFEASSDVIFVADSKEGWAKAYSRLISSLFLGDIPQVDYSQVRSEGEKLKVFGGRASGPAPLKRLFDFTVAQFKKAKGRRLNSLEVHDIMCMVGEIVVVGGVRRSALISLSNLSDHRMRDAKSGQWWADNPQRALANNSVAYTEKPNVEIFIEEWLSLVKSKSGERGIFNREAAQRQAAKYGRRSKDEAYGTNPCSEIILRDKQFCNLSEIVIRDHDTKETIKKKVRIATIIGTFQCSLTDFGFLNETWQDNTKAEALLGVSMTGIMDNTFTAGLENVQELKDFLDEMRVYSVEVNKEWAEILNVNPSTAITAVKPSGTVSQLCDTASGIHARHNANYIRTVRIDKKDPVYEMFKAAGMPMEDDVMKPHATAVVSYPQSAPRGAVTRDQLSAIEQMETWLIYQRHWCEHKPSVTISVGDDEWMEVGAWVYKYFDEVSGISFLPRSDHTYQQAPYQDMTSEELAEWVKNNPSPNIDWNDLTNFEKDDQTVASQTLACTAGACEI